ncbi:hypothetical protein ACQB6R_01065 [Propionibacteriaceae bacterium G1746]|uniref:hypothetical protein n=1 Tax=Aestuariimicrobium sp. G57 TaxID=3418485 RepID=UPI003C1F8649
MYIPRFFIKQKIALTVNRYDIIAANPDGSMGELICAAEQKRFAFKEQVTFFADPQRTRPVFSFKARKVMDFNSGYDVFDEAGAPIGYFKKDFGASLFRSTFHVEGPGFAGTGQERSQLVALLMRFGDIPFLPIHFDYNDSSGAPLFSIDRQGSVRDKYTVDVRDQRIDFRFAAAVGVGMDALLQR